MADGIAKGLRGRSVGVFEIETTSYCRDLIFEISPQPPIYSAHSVAQSACQSSRYCAISRKAWQAAKPPLRQEQKLIIKHNKSPARQCRAVHREDQEYIIYKRASSQDQYNEKDAGEDEREYNPDQESSISPE
uniref:Uncharacterized protein n=1 Tax=Coccidioides posadasii RMSCC 3488 TaxID=454284 RepID=A0A0J6IBM6_COCPO|nr:hypothetical protein CPAG_05375 [Coccidioides posadasii RMSCC 3488]